MYETTPDLKGSQVKRNEGCGVEEAAILGMLKCSIT